LQVGDFEELKAVTLVFCKDRKTQLLIGSVKSNMGHTEEAAGLCDIIRVVTGMKGWLHHSKSAIKQPQRGCKFTYEWIIEVEYSYYSRMTSSLTSDIVTS
jgi:3-oxoacyl-(acyl-carrier-protein) synthase